MKNIQQTTVIIELGNRQFLWAARNDLEPHSQMQLHALSYGKQPLHVIHFSDSRKKKNCNMPPWPSNKMVWNTFQITELCNTFKNGMTKGRSGKLVASCSLEWNSSIVKVEFCWEKKICLGDKIMKTLSKRNSNWRTLKLLNNLILVRKLRKKACCTLNGHLIKIHKGKHKHLRHSAPVA